MGNTIASCLCSKTEKDIKIHQSDQIFPNVVIIEILSRLPLKSVARCQLVCKDWQSLIHNHYFTEMHMAHRQTVYPYHNTLGNHPAKRWRRNSFAYEHGCNGLLLMVNVKDGKHYVWNPAIRRVLKLPYPHDPSLGFAFSYVPATKTYRIVSFYVKSGGKLGCEVLTPGLDKAWRNLPEIENMYSPSRKEERVSVVSAGGAVHCVFVTRVGRETSVEVVSLDLETEEFTMTRLPELGDWKNYWDVDWDGKLAIVDVVGKNMEVLELEDYKKGKWSEKKKIIGLSSFLKGDEEVFPLLVMKGEIWLWLKDREIITYTIATGERTKRKKSKTFAMENKLYPYKPSLIRFKGMVSDKKLEDYRLSFFSS